MLMKRLIFDVSRWHLMLYREERQMPRATERDDPMLRLEDELFERLYTGEGERLSGRRSDAVHRLWAERIHVAAHLKARDSGRSAAGIVSGRKLADPALHL
jgi:hypothetical protein